MGDPSGSRVRLPDVDCRVARVVTLGFLTRDIIVSFTGDQSSLPIGPGIDFFRTSVDGSPEFTTLFVLEISRDRHGALRSAAFCPGASRFTGRFATVS